MTPHSLGRINFSAVLASLLLLAMQLTSFAQTPTTRAWDDPSAVKGVAEGKDPDITDNFILYRYDTEPYRLDPGPHLFIDYRYILPGRTGYIFPDGTEAPRYDGDAERLPGIIGVPSGAPSNIRIEAQEAQKLGIVLENDQPWEYCLGYHTLLHFDGKYRLWYDTIPPRNSKIGDRGVGPGSRAGRSSSRAWMEAGTAAASSVASG